MHQLWLVYQILQLQCSCQSMKGEPKMGFAGGYTGKMLVVDLTNQTYHEEPTSEDMAGKFIGGAGINAALAHKYLIPHDDPLSPTNYLIFGAGPMVGTMTPGSGKCNLTGRSVHTKFLGTTNQGYFGMLKFAGYDHLLITGRAETPVYLKIEDDTVTFCPAVISGAGICLKPLT